MDKVSTFKSRPLKFSSMENTDTRIKIITHWRLHTYPEVCKQSIVCSKRNGVWVFGFFTYAIQYRKTQSHHYSILAAGWRIISLEFTVCADISIWNTCTIDGQKAKAVIGVFPTWHATRTYTYKCPDFCGFWHCPSV